MVDFLNADKELQKVLEKERADVRRVGESSARLTTDALAQTKDALEKFAIEIAPINSQSDAALNELVSSIDKYNTLKNKPLFSQIGDAFRGIVNPEFDINVVGERVKQNKQQFELAEVRRTQVQEKLNVATRIQQANIGIAEQELNKELRELELVRGELAQKRQDRKDAYEQEQIFLTTGSPEQLNAAKSKGQLTERQVFDELDRRKRQALSMEQLDMSVQMQRANLVEYNRLQILKNTPKHQVQAMLDEAVKPENGGVFVRGNLKFTSAELETKVNEYSAVEAENIGDDLKTSEAVSYGASIVNLLSRFTGTAESDSDDEAIYTAASGRSDIFSASEQSLIRQVAYLNMTLNETEDGKTRAIIAEEYLKKAGEIETVLETKLSTVFPQKEVQTALKQQLDNGVITDSLGSQKLLIASSISGFTTGSPIHDDMLLRLREASTAIATAPELVDIGPINEKYQESINTATSIAYLTGFYDVLKEASNDPELQDLNLVPIINSRKSVLYNDAGQFYVGGLMNYFNSFDDGAARFARFERVIQRYTKDYSQRTFGFTGASPQGSVAISSINNQVFGNQPVENFIAYWRNQLTKQGQMTFSRLRDARL